MATTKRTSLALMIVGGLAAATLPVAIAATATAAAPGAVAATAATHVAAAKLAKKPKLTLSSTRLKVGDKVKLTGTRYPKKPTSMFITICGFPPGATNCDVDLRHVKQITYTGTGKFKTKYKIAVTKFATASGKINCKKKQCVVGTTNALNPKDHAYNGVAKFSVRR